MKIFIILLMALVYPAFGRAQNSDEQAIKNILTAQTISWNSGNVEKFMQGYWQNDSLVFIGKSGITHGWKQSLDNYKKNYPDSIAMGKLDFNILQLKRLSNMYYFVIGKWHLLRSIGDLQGYFTLVFQKINGKWFIIADHSS